MVVAKNEKTCHLGSKNDQKLSPQAYHNWLNQGCKKIRKTYHQKTLAGYKTCSQGAKRRQTNIEGEWKKLSYNSGNFEEELRMETI